MPTLFFLLLATLLAAFSPGAQCQTAPAPPPAETAWKLVKTKNGVTVYVRPFPTPRTKQYKATTLANATVPSLVAVFKDGPNARQWVNRSKAYHNLKVTNAFEWVTYSEIELPWPFHNKDLVTRNVLVCDPSARGATIYITSLPTLIAEVPGKARIYKSEGEWQFVFLTPGTTQVTYLVYAEADGIVLPPWLIEPIIADGLAHTLRGLSQQATQPAYQHVPLDALPR